MILYEECCNHNAMIPHIPLLDGHGEISLAGLGHQDPEQIICSAKES